MHCCDQEELEVLTAETSERQNGIEHLAEIDTLSSVFRLNRHVAMRTLRKNTIPISQRAPAEQNGPRLHICPLAKSSWPPASWLHSSWAKTTHVRQWTSSSPPLSFSPEAMMFVRASTRPPSHTRARRIEKYRLTDPQRHPSRATPPRSMPSDNRQSTR